MECNKLRKSEFDKIEGVLKAIQFMLENSERNSNIEMFFDEKDVSESLFSDVTYDIKNDELYQAIERLRIGKTEPVAVDSDGVGFTVVEILHNHYDYVFGFTEENGERVFYLAEPQDSYNEELERDETNFFIDETPVCLNDCIRIGGGFA